MSASVGLLDDDLVVAVAGVHATSRWPAFSTHLGMSVLLPESDE